MKLYKTEQFEIEYDENLNLQLVDLVKKLNESIVDLFKLFDIKKFRKIKIVIFNDNDKFRNYIYHLRGENKSLPEYAKGVFDGGNIYFCIDLYKNIDNKKLSQKIIHELFHIIYKELIWDKKYKKRIVWFDEGMAQYFSGEYNDVLYSEEKFELWFSKLLEDTKEIPILNNKTHQTSFVTENYNGYKLSVLAIKYLYDTLGLDELKKLLHDEKKIIKYGKTIVIDSINYYKEKLNIKNRSF